MISSTQGTEETVSRKTRLYNIKSPSINERNRLLRQATRYASMVDTACIAMVKSLGSSLKPHEWTITMTKDEFKQAKPYERLNIADGPNGEVILSVSIPDDLREQVEAFEAEMNQSVTGDVVLPVADPPQDAGPYDNNLNEES